MTTYGRPTKLTPFVKKRLLEAALEGASYRDAAEYAGISEDTLRVWRQENEAFAAEFRQAEGTAAISRCRTLKKSSDEGDWRAALSWLERRRAADWSPKQIIEATGKDGGPIRHEHGFTLDIERCTAEELEVIERAMLRQMALASGEESEEGE